MYLFFLQDLSSLSYNPTSITKEEYFSNLIDLGERDIGRPLDQTTKTQKFKATLWLCEEYPLSLQQQVVPIIDLMSASNAHFKKLRDFITLQLPAGFPVKIGKIVHVYNRKSCIFTTIGNNQLIIILMFLWDFLANLNDYRR